MKALLLAAGLGTRLRPITDTIPKCLVDIGGRPLLDLWLQILSIGGVNNILINTHYLPEKVEIFVSESQYQVDIKVTHEPCLLGTGGTILANESYFNGEPLLLIHADNLSVFKLVDFIEKYNSRGPDIDITMMIYETDHPQMCGIVELDSDGIVRGFHEKVASPPSNLANGAVYILSPRVIQFIKSLNRPIIDFSTEVIPYFLGRINTYHNAIYHRDIGSLVSYKKATVDFESKKLSNYFNINNAK